MPRQSQPTVPSLIIDKIDTLGATIASQIETMNADLGGRLSELSGKVQTQNGRIGKLEVAHGQCQVERRQERVDVRALSRKRVAILGGGGMISGALVLELLRYLGQALHKAGLLG